METTDIWKASTRQQRTEQTERKVGVNNPAVRSDPKYERTSDETVAAFNLIKPSCDTPLGTHHAPVPPLHDTIYPRMSLTASQAPRFLDPRGLSPSFGRFIKSPNRATLPVPPLLGLRWPPFDKRQPAHKFGDIESSSHLLPTKHRVQFPALDL
ncbi:unnamed protein product [Parascedosporium putredinis]|uniref:Uncharacterized protein n=1 Tax=Parascedosporium putredinis TaxID=1442378 RepID=A0A9P1MF97_9PEZI|nr:unnamed protein product [Parascedosporium putredinis]CAI8004609.1 unnamed protein product [Parascedosporium putredinis]